MKYQHIKEGNFRSRPNRFIARVELEGKEETVHVKNTGRCQELLLPGARVFLEQSDNPNRKTAYDLIGVEKAGLGLINMDSQAPNQVVKEWLLAQQQGKTSPELTLFPDLTMIRPEYTWGKSRIDFYFEQAGKRCLMEVKGVTLERERIAYFPDAPTERGIKHVKELAAAAASGIDCYLAFVIQMPGILEIRPNDATHPQFGQAVRQAMEQGVKVLSLGCEIGRDTLDIVHLRNITLFQG